MEREDIFIPASRNPDDNKPVFLKILGNKRVVSQLVALLSDIRHILASDEKFTFTVNVNSTKGANPILFSVNEQEIEDYKPDRIHYIN